MTTTAAPTKDASTRRTAPPRPAGGLNWLAPGAGLIALTVTVVLPWPASVVIAAAAAVLSLVVLGLALASRGPGIGHGVAGLVTSLVAVLLAGASAVVAEFDLSLVGGDDRGSLQQDDPLPGQDLQPPPTPSTVTQDVILLFPAQIGASGTAPDSRDAAGDPVTFDVYNVIDGDPTTAWRVPGDGIGDYLLLSFDQPVHVTGIGVVPGWAQVDPTNGADRFLQNRRVSAAQFQFSDGQVLDVDFSDQPLLQQVGVGVETTELIMWITGSTAAPRNFAAVSELQVYGWVLQ